MSLIFIQALQETLVLAPLVVGVWMAFFILRFPDLSFQGSFSMGAATFAVLAQQSGGNQLIVGGSLVIAVAVGAAAGMTTAVFNSKLGVPSLVSGIAVGLMGYSLSLIIMSGPSVTLSSHNLLYSQFLTPASELLEAEKAERLRLLESSALSQLLVVLGITVLVLLSFKYLLTSRLGLLLRATGENPSACRNFGVSPETWLAIGLTIANGAAALSGALFAQHLRFADVSFGPSVLGLALGAVVLGESFRVHGSWGRRILYLVVAIGFFQTVRIAVLSSSATSNYLRFLEGLILVAAVAFAVRVRRQVPLRDLRL